MRVLACAPALTLRRAQITHGRVAMLAALGWVVQERWHPLFDGAIEGAPSVCLHPTFQRALAWLRLTRSSRSQARR
jgi:hypothetical protein